MENIRHRLTIDAPLEHVHEAVATKAGLERWWTGHPVGGDESVGAQLLFYFSGSDPAAVMEVVENTDDKVAWRCVGGASTVRQALAAGVVD
jgi:uncharacterized protein YndB with AHSA1/START domain